MDGAVSYIDSGSGTNPGRSLARPLSRPRLLYSAKLAPQFCGLNLFYFKFIIKAGILLEQILNLTLQLKEFGVGLVVLDSFFVNL